MLCVGAAFFGIFFLTVLVQAVRGYSALKTGLGYLPLTAGIMVGSGAAAGLVPRVGTRSVLAGRRLAAGGGCGGLGRRGEARGGAGAEGSFLRRPPAACCCSSRCSPWPVWGGGRRRWGGGGPAQASQEGSRSA